jgi:hypothetical protein
MQCYVFNAFKAPGSLNSTARKKNTMQAPLTHFMDRWTGKDLYNPKTSITWA